MLYSNRSATKNLNHNIKEVNMRFVKKLISAIIVGAMAIITMIPASANEGIVTSGKRTFMIF